MNRRITKKHAKWRGPPRVMGPLSVNSAAHALPRLIQRLQSRNEVWVVVSEGPPERVGCLISARHAAAATIINEMPVGRNDPTGGDHDA